MPFLFCPKCLKPVSSHDTICHHCGASLRTAPAGKGVLGKIKQMIAWLCIACMALFAGLGRACQKAAGTKSGKATKKAVKLMKEIGPDAGKMVYDIYKDK